MGADGYRADRMTLPHTALFPGGRTKALTMSYDDGRLADRRLVAIFDRHGIRGTFHLNSGNLDKNGYLRSAEVSALFARHEISAHSATHPWLEKLPPDRVAAEILDDRRALEKLAGYPIRGMSYPFGTWSHAVVRMLPALGIEYARTVASSGRFDLPRTPLLWDPTCHHHDDLAAKVHAFLDEESLRPMLLYVWGHSFEFDRDRNWDLIETFCARVGGRTDIWYATNIEIIDYVNALDRIRFSADEAMAFNPSSMPVWLRVNDVAVEIGPGNLQRF